MGARLSFEYRRKYDLPLFKSDEQAIEFGESITKHHPRVVKRFQKEILSVIEDLMELYKLKLEQNNDPMAKDIIRWIGYYQKALLVMLYPMPLTRHRSVESLTS